MRALALAAVLAAALALAAGDAAAAGLAFAPCPGEAGVACATLAVPLDRSGAIPGTVGLHVERRRAEGRERGTLVVLAGGPGQGTSRVFGAGALDWLAGLFRGYAIVVVDPRGTGRSGVLQCDWPAAGEQVDAAPFVAACAERLAGARGLYATRDAAEDIEAVRAALGVERLALYGTSYGTKLAQAYALAYPGRVERLLLDSALSTGWEVAGTTSLQAAPRLLRELCAAVACPPGAGDLAARFVRVANRLGGRPRVVAAVGPDGRRDRRLVVDGATPFDLLVSSDANPALRALLPAAIALADRGDLRGLARLAALAADAPRTASTRFSLALFTTVLCEEGAFPWERSAPVEGREAALEAALAAVPAADLGPFGRWAAARSDLQVAAYCRTWPQTAAAPTLSTGPLPDVPVLVVQGRLDVRTPLELARRVAAAFPQARVLAVRGTGHSVLSPAEPCVEDAVRDWLAGRPVPTACSGSGSWLGAVGPPPARLVDLAVRGALPARVARTLAAVRTTLADGALAGLASLLQGGRAPVGGLAAGVLRPSWTSFALDRYAVVPGVELTGRLALVGTELVGRVRVSGAAAAAGELRVGEGVAAGVLAGTAVG